MNLPKTGSILRRLLIVIPVVVGLTLVSLFMPAQHLSIEGIGLLSFETAITLSVGYEVAHASPDVATNSPISNTGSAWTNSTYAYDNDANAATQTSGSGSNVYSTYGFNLTGATITQVRVRTDAWCTGTAGLTDSNQPTAYTDGTYPWTNPSYAYTGSNQYATCTYPIVTYRATGTMAHDTTSNFTIGLPSGMSSGDVVFMAACCYTGGTLSISSAGSITTWNAVAGTPVDVASGDKLYLWWGVWSSGTTGATLSNSGGNHEEGRTIAFYNIDTTSPIDVTTYGTETTSDTNLSFATGLTSTYNNELCVFFWTTTYDPSSSDSTSAFSAEADSSLGSVTERMDNDINEGNGGGVGCATGTKATIGSLGTFTATYAYSSPKAYIVVALRPKYTTNNEFQEAYGTFGYSDMGGTITKVEIGYEAYATATQKLNLYTSADGGGSWSSAHQTVNLATSDPNTYTYVDVTSDQSWTWTLLNDTNFRIKMGAVWVSGQPTFYVDNLIVRVTYTTATNDQIRVAVSWDGGSSWSGNHDTTLSGSEQTYWTDVTSDTSWTPDKLSDSNFQVRVNSVTVGDTSTVNLDWLPVEVTYTTAAEPSITVDPTFYNFGAVAESSTPYTTTTYFTIDNSSTMLTDQTISVTTSTWSGGSGWAHNDSGSPGANAAALLANRGGTWGTGDIIVKYSSPNYIYENCPADTDYYFGLKLLAPTSFTDGVPKQIVVRITAVAG